MKVRCLCFVLYNVGKLSVDLPRRSKFFFQGTICGNCVLVSLRDEVISWKVMLTSTCILFDTFIPRNRRSILRFICNVSLCASVRITPITCFQRALCVMVNCIRTANVSCFSICSCGLTVISIRNVVSVKRFREIRLSGFSSFIASYLCIFLFR